MMNERLEQLKDRERSLKAQLTSVTNQQRWLQFKAAWLFIVIHLRPLVDNLQTGRWFVVLIGTVFLAAMSFMFVDIPIGARGFSVIVGLSVASLSASVLAVMLYSGTDADVIQSHSNAVHGLNQIRSRVNAIADEHKVASAELRSYVAELAIAEQARQDAARALRQRQASQQIEDARVSPLRRLYQQNWRALRDIEFEKYLEAVFIALGYSVETTAVTGDQGVDLVVSKNGVRIAIQVKGFHHSVNNAAVQQAFAGMAHYHCHRCAVITNSRFTSGAVSLAESTNCLLIGEEAFEDFVMGRINLTALHPGGIVGRK